MKVKDLFIFKIQDSDMGASIMFVVKDFVLIISDFDIYLRKKHSGSKPIPFCL